MSNNLYTSWPEDYVEGLNDPFSRPSGPLLLRPIPGAARLLPPPQPARTTFTPQLSLPSRDPEPETSPPINYRETLRDVEEALHNADMALRNAREAFRSAGGGGGAPSQNNVVDLTNVSSDGSTEDNFMTQTRHPQDTSRGRSTIRAANSFNEPAFGPHSSSIAALNSNHRGTGFTPVASFRDFLEPNFNYQPIGPPIPGPPIAHTRRPDLNTSRADETAVRRQAQARRDWERVERRNRQRAEQQARLEAQERERAQRQEAETRIAGDTAERRQRSRRSSNASDAPSISDLSESSLGSSSVDQRDTADPTNETMNPIDLTTVDDSNTLTALLAKEQQDAINAQNKVQQTTTPSGNTPTALSGYKCAICMDSPTHATTTICGHLFCHRCIMDSLKWSEQLRRDEIGPGRRTQGLCPVCRKPLLSKEVSTNARSTGGLVGLEIKKMKRKDFESRKERKEFFEKIEEKGKQRARTEDVVDLDAIKGESEEEKKIKPLGKGLRKRKRGETARSSVDDDDSLFGSP
ncbi:hypothetical protein PMZ80_001575 [Knufia obscura]|uniref:RING-type domain-containing protein n=2 Tax=Knufia TaxID=430999 RepID=A0AAN8EJY8_9EURO|nr:hypothetical protein PMZ80_001575 [Knufia obscura]KAK5955600.1 hypothetical protein OHC33_003241 [Knufia fluminis]